MTTLYPHHQAAFRGFTDANTHLTRRELRERRDALARQCCAWPGSARD